ncbi:lipopolysaccharide-binding protein-like isoform X1 [Callorhinus ursinus]|uniref:lipopolysaccharide-binding protein-like isoform X1 n=1 Tax=Callorhinus ursinus TaxID=34884 RepID=UPI003CD02AAB
MMARLYCVVVTLLLLAEVSGFEEGATNPGVVARITRKGLAYARQLGVAILKKELSTIKLPDFSGSFKVSWIKTVSYDFYRLTIHRFELRNSDLRLRPRQGVRASLSNNYMFVSGNWKVKKAFVTLDGTFDVNVDGISISVSLNLGKDQSGRPTASVAHCRNSIGHISVDISGQLSWILNLLHKRIENNFKNILEQKIREMVRKSTTSHLEPYLRTPPVSSRIDQVAGIDYSLVGAPKVTSQVLDTPFKVSCCGERTLELKTGRKSVLPPRVGSYPPSLIHLPLKFPSLASAYTSNRKLICPLFISVSSTVPWWLSRSGNAIFLQFCLLSKHLICFLLCARC